MSAPVSFAIHPVDLADVLHNSVEISKEAKGIPNVPHVMLAYEPGAEAGVVLGYGVGRYAGGRTAARLEGLPATESASVCIERDVAAALQSQVRKIKGGKAARAHVTIYPEPTTITVKNEYGQEEQSTVNLVVTAGEDTLADLLDSDPDGTWDTAFDLLDDLLSAGVTPLDTPVAFSTDVFSRLGKIRADGPAIDLRRTKHERIVGVAIGSGFRGIIGDVDRETFAVGGPWGDGPGSPDHLF